MPPKSPPKASFKPPDALKISDSDTESDSDWFGCDGWDKGLRLPPSPPSNDPYKTIHEDRFRQV